MLKYYKTNPDTKELERRNGYETDCWIDVVRPTDDEINEIVDNTGINRNLLIKMRDADELPRIETSGDATLIVVDVPALEEDSKDNNYITYPLGIIVVDDKLTVTISPVETGILDDFRNGTVDIFETNKETRFLIQIITATATRYIKVLDSVYESIDAKEKKMRKNTKNEDLINLLTTEKTLVYFANSLKENRLVLDRLAKGNVMPLHDDDIDSLEDALVENEQAHDMANVYRKILKSISETYSSVINNNQNEIMKFLAGITIVLSIPTIISSYFGMNVPFGIIGTSPLSAITILVGSIIISVILGIWLKKRGML